MESDIVVSVQNAYKSFGINKFASIRDGVFGMMGKKVHKVDTVEVLKNVSFEVKRGEVFGVIGRNGSGKTTLFKAIMGAIALDSGTIETQGKLIRLALGQGFDRELSARQNIYLNASLLGLTFKEIGNKFKGIVEFAGIENFVDTEIKYFSTGMKHRLAFSIAKHTDAEVLLMDEFFAGVGDINFRKKSFDLFQNTMTKNRTIMYVSHNLKNLERYCHRLLLLHEGAVLKIGDPAEVIELYKETMKNYGK